jgi:hypothetical protein
VCDAVQAKLPWAAELGALDQGDVAVRDAGGVGELPLTPAIHPPKESHGLANSDQVALGERLTRLPRGCSSPAVHRHARSV